jgi:hypothetical protein
VSDSGRQFESPSVVQLIEASIAVEQVVGEYYLLFLETQALVERISERVKVEL